MIEIHIQVYYMFFLAVIILTLTHLCCQDDAISFPIGHDLFIYFGVGYCGI